MDRDERRHTVIGFAILLVLLVLAVVGVSAVKGAAAGSGGETQAVADVRGTNDINPTTLAWYGSTEQVRYGVASTAAVVRRYVAATDGQALRPACATFADAVTMAKSFAGVPLDVVGTGWRIGLVSYADAAAECAHLWDGTPRGPAELLGAVMKSLDAGDGQWRQIARRLGQPTQPPLA